MEATLIQIDDTHATASDREARAEFRSAILEGFEGRNRPFPWRSQADPYAVLGLEADVVFLIDVDDLATPDAGTAMYVGSSRARTNLYVYLEAGVRAVYEDRAASFGRRVAGAP